jgi:NADH:ubiquinone oxidoreductase subunit 6 (subunit J)
VAIFETLLFLMFGALAVVSGLLILISRNIVRMAYLLVAMLLSVGGLYFLMGAYFLGVIQIIVYVGGVAVLVVFGVMLTSRQAAAGLLPRVWEAIWLLIVAFLVFAGMAVMFLETRFHGELKQTADTVSDIGKNLLGKFLGPFELASVLLLVVLLGAAYQGRPKAPKLGSKEEKGINQ